MSNLYIIDSASHTVLTITNTKVIDFYNSNSHINFESVNLWLVELLNMIGSKQFSTAMNQIETSILYPEEPKIKELDSFLNNMQEATRKLVQTISNKYILIKSEYVREFKTISSEIDCRDLCFNANKTFFESVCSLLSNVIRIRCSNIGDKVAVILRQFNKILTANTDQLFCKQEPPAKIDDYLYNFESNSTHMIQAVIQLFSECLTLYESRVKHAIESIKKREDTTFTTYYKLIYELNDVLHQLPDSNDDTDNSGSFEYLLSQTFTTASISRDTDSNEYQLMREDKPTIYIETHEIRDHNIGVSDTKQFLKRAIEKNMNSILISQYTGITSKPNFHIEIHNNIVVIYLHKLANCSDTLKKATDMIDAISNKLSDFCSLSENKYSIPKDILDGVNREYQQFIIQKEIIITGLKEQQKTLLSKLDDMRFSVLDKYLSTRYSSCKKQGYNCDMCNNFNVGTLKGLAAHKRGCARKIASSLLPASHPEYIPVTANNSGREEGGVRGFSKRSEGEDPSCLRRENELCSKDIVIHQQNKKDSANNRCAASALAREPIRSP